MANTRFINITKARRLMHPSRRISSLIANIINPNTGKIVKACVGLNPAININYNRRSYSKDYCINTLGSDMEYMQDVFCRGVPEHPTTRCSHSSRRCSIRSISHNGRCYQMNIRRRAKIRAIRLQLKSGSTVDMSKVMELAAILIDIQFHRDLEYWPRIIL